MAAPAYRVDRRGHRCSLGLSRPGLYLDLQLGEVESRLVWTSWQGANRCCVVGVIFSLPLDPEMEPMGEKLTGTDYSFIVNDYNLSANQTTLSISNDHCLANRHC